MKPKPLLPGELIAEELKARGWSQRHLAQKLDVSDAFVSSVIKSKRMLGPRMCIRLGDAFGCSAELFWNLASAWRLEQAKLAMLLEESGVLPANASSAARKVAHL